MPRAYPGRIRDVSAQYATKIRRAFIQDMRLVKDACFVFGSDNVAMLPC